uniref:Mitotic spindle positioning n=1 Tax=Nannospalax galili TaxID=1026970 RepID=A0A8C6RW53_NANGA
MDRVTRYPIFSNPNSSRVTGLALDGHTSYTIELVGVGSEAEWSREEPQAWPDVERARVSHKRQAFSSQPSAQSQFLEDEEDEEMKTYCLDASNTLCSQSQDLDMERWVIIQGQAVKKCSTAATVQGANDQGDPRLVGQPRSTVLKESLVDREQIDFLVARQQFLSLEKANTNPVSGNPMARVTLAHPPPGVSQAPKDLNRPHIANGFVAPVPVTSPVKEMILEKRVRGGFPAASNICTVNNPSTQPSEVASEIPKETPIEREIRLAQEREADLREQRGLGRAAGHQELVQIPSRPVLSKVNLLEGPQRRDRGRPSLYVQRDMVQETQREEDHRREGLQVGRASTPNWASQDSQPGLWRSLSSDSILSPTLDARVANPAPETRKINRITPDAYQPYLGSGTPQLGFSALGVYSKPSGLPMEDSKAVATRSPKRLSESSGKFLSSKQEGLKSPGGPPRANGGVLRREYFFLRPLSFRVPDAPQQAEQSHTWGWEVAGAPALRLHKSPSSGLLEREMQSVLQREREVAEERRTALFPEVFSPMLDQEQDGEQYSRSSSRASGITGSYSVSESPVFTPIHLHSNLTWKAEAPVDYAPGQRKKETWYAGINPADHVNSEVLGATRVTRHKNALAERWEARIYASEDED